MERERINNMKLLILTVSLICHISVGNSTSTFDVSEILDAYPKFSTLNQLLSLTGVADEINSRTGITLFAPPNDILASFQAGLPYSSMRDMLRHHVATEYFDFIQLENLTNPLSVTTLLQTTVPDVNIISDSSQGAVINNTIITHIVSDVNQIDTQISILEVDQVLHPVSYPSLPPPLPQPLNRFNITSSFGTLPNFKIFSSYLMETGVDLLFQGRQRTSIGCTIFVPTDEAFNSIPGQWFERLSKNDQRLLLEYHALNRFFSMYDLWEMVESPEETVASTLTQGEGFILQINSTRGVVSLRAGISNATVTATLYQSTDTIMMLAIDTVLLPRELFENGFPLAPSSEPPAQYPIFQSHVVSSPSSSPDPSRQQPTTTAQAPTPTNAGMRSTDGASIVSSLALMVSLVLSLFFFL
ncbi:hypothetical protein R1flu_015997 [Riccia fluitans]|uniref:FAS1 domain-containing protein n=1 Tax=Riccia fluitans TaxID=41844 RepID=A0ABD1YL17_9MARC